MDYLYKNYLNDHKTKNKNKNIKNETKNKINVNENEQYIRSLKNDIIEILTNEKKTKLKIDKKLIKLEKLKLHFEQLKQLNIEHLINNYNTIKEQLEFLKNENIKINSQLESLKRENIKFRNELEYFKNEETTSNQL